jgi:glycosyltransferase involved in cell wall biosynthesis
MKHLRIIHIIPSLIKGGAERLTLDICIELNKRDDCVVKLITLHPENMFVEECKGLDVEFCHSYVIPSISKKNQINISELQASIERFKPNVIHSHLFEAEIVAREVNYQKAVWFSHLHDNMFQFRPMKLIDWTSKKRVTECFERKWILKRYKACNNNFIAISRDTEQYFKQVLPQTLHRITLIHNAIPFIKFNHTEIRFPSGNLIKMVCTGSLVDKKNQIFLTEVVRELNLLGYLADLHILGDGVNRGKILQRIKTLGISDQVHLEGNVDDVASHLHKASFYVHPATYEPFGLALIEAMAASLVCVILNGQGNLDIHEEGKTGFLIDPINPQKFAKALIHCSKNPKIYKQIAEYNNNYAKAFDIEKYASIIIGHYKKAISIKYDINPV